MSTVEFKGETFTLTEDGVSEFALLEFAEAAADGQDGDTMQGMASMLRLVRDCIAADEWGRFRVLARKERAGVADLMPIIQKAMEQAAERPTGRPSDSTDGPAITPAKSESSADDKGLERLAGRPDLQLAVLRQREAMTG